MGDDDDELVGTLLNDRYRITAPLMTGRFGDFWKAVDTEDDSAVAVKMLKPGLFTDEDSIKRFERETLLLAKWKHPNLLRVVANGRTDKNLPWIVTEAKHGRPLYDEIANQECSTKMCCHIASQIARVLAGAHARGIVHRGLCPDSVMLCHERGDKYRVKLLDFGVASMPSTEEDDGLTKIGQRLGDAEYMSPEYIESFTQDARSDLYALGILTFELLVGQAPFVGQSRRVMMKHMDEPAFPPSDLSMRELPDWLDKLVLKLLEKEPDDRYQTAMDVVDVFKAHR